MKSALSTYNALKHQLLKRLHDEMASCDNIRSVNPVFSLVFGESTKVTWSKVLVVIVRYCWEKTKEYQQKPSS